MQYFPEFYATSELMGFIYPLEVTFLENFMESCYKYNWIMDIFQKIRVFILESTATYKDNTTDS